MTPPLWPNGPAPQTKAWATRCERAAMCLWFVSKHPDDAPIDQGLIRELWVCEPLEVRDRWTTVVMMISNID